MRKLIVFASALLLTLSVTAQDPHFSQFFASPLTLNPAFTGKFSGTWRLAANHRDQWPSIPKAYVTTSASLDFPILKSKIPDGDVFGIGISGLTDASANNILKLNYGSLSMSYHKALDENGYSTIGAGFQATYSSLNLDVSKLTFEDMLTQNGFTGTTSDLITNGNNQSYFDVNAGLLYSGSTNGQNNFYLGASMYHINRPKVGFKDKNWYLSGRISIHGGGSFPLSDLLTVHTSLIHQIQNKASETTVGAALAVNLNQEAENPSSLYIGSWVRFNDAIVPYVGIEFGGLRIGASYDFNISSLKAATASRGGSEFSLIFIKRPAEYQGIPCPKF
ncbi:MAG: PorP/SprF family type IX secretion system membrane protein [Ferruginibacter sp.]|nr:PorP/SprF family type IX secretion system membrane protein [Ferruginibacter sp.]MBU9936474.1 PorP/SprF family type IX secretion system membrane protein [Ferruginibacter sp.]HQY11981.1 PorP/SprF family type IX secretion system membrane protein [Ferruginibacter sp.]